tara:strand:+ start:205 stop:450 length:246 start_codon:yes stop_codon:yes gene_type:complete
MKEKIYVKMVKKADGGRIVHGFAISDWNAKRFTMNRMNTGHILCDECCAHASQKLGLVRVAIETSNKKYRCENKKCLNKEY